MYLATIYMNITMIQDGIECFLRTVDKFIQIVTHGDNVNPSDD